MHTTPSPCNHGESGRVDWHGLGAVLTCAAYCILAPFNTNECAASSARIPDVRTCQAAAETLGRTFGSSGTFPATPRGCYVMATWATFVYFNDHAAGSAAADRQLVCLVMGTPAPTISPTRVPTALPTTALPTSTPTVIGACTKVAFWGS